MLFSIPLTTQGCTLFSKIPFPKLADFAHVSKFQTWVVFRFHERKTNMKQVWKMKCIKVVFCKISILENCIDFHFITSKYFLCLISKLTQHCHYFVHFIMYRVRAEGVSLSWSVFNNNTPTSMIITTKSRKLRFF